MRWRWLLVLALVFPAPAHASMMTMGAGTNYLTLVPSVTCTSSVSTYAAVQTALTTSSNAGKTVCVTADISGVSFLNTSTDMASEMRLVAQPRDGTISLPGVTCAGCSNVTIEGFEFTGDTGLWVDAPSLNIHFIKNRCHDQEQTCVNLTGGASGTNGLWVIGNTITGYEAPLPGESGKGYGVRGDTPISNAKFNYNAMGPTGPAGGEDGFEIGQCATCEFIGNVFIEIRSRGNPEAHPDAIMSWNDSTNVTIKDNRVYDSHNVLLSPDGDGYVVQNNLIVQENQGNRCVDNSSNGSSGEVHPQSWTITNNTITDCDNGGWDQNIESDNARGGNVFNDNIVASVSCQISTGGAQEADLFGTGNADADGNVFTQAAVNCMSGSTNTTWTPNFTGAATNGDYVPVGLPGGYTSAGYRVAPAGPGDCGVAEGCIYDG